MLDRKEKKHLHAASVDTYTLKQVHQWWRCWRQACNSLSSYVRCNYIRAPCVMCCGLAWNHQIEFVIINESNATLSFQMWMVFVWANYRSVANQLIADRKLKRNSYFTHLLQIASCWLKLRLYSKCLFLFILDSFSFSLPLFVCFLHSFVRDQVYNAFFLWNSIHLNFVLVFYFVWRYFICLSNSLLVFLTPFLSFILFTLV